MQPRIRYTRHHLALQHPGFRRGNAVEIRLGAAAADASAFARIESQLRAAGSVASSVHGDTRVLRAELSGGTAISVLAGNGASILAIVDGTSDPEQARSIVARCIGV